MSDGIAAEDESAAGRQQQHRPRRSCFHVIFPVSTLDLTYRPDLIRPYGRDLILPETQGDVVNGLSSSAVTFAQVFCSGKYMVLVSGLFAAGKSLPPFAVGHTKRVSPTLSNTVSGFTVTFPVDPSILVTTFWRTVGVAHKNSPV